jgi:hypothetical protein
MLKLFAFFVLTWIKTALAVTIAMNAAINRLTGTSGTEDDLLDLTFHNVPDSLFKDVVELGLLNQLRFHLMISKKEKKKILFSRQTLFSYITGGIYVWIPFATTVPSDTATLL